MKFKFIILFLVFILSGSLLINSCKKNGSIVYNKPHPLNLTIPEGFPPPVYQFENNPLTEEGFELGKRLFFDNTLSQNFDVSCGSCHQPHAGFTTFDHDLGHGTNHQHTSRNVPGIINMVWHPAMQWDGSVEHLEDQPLTCMTAPEKMGEDVNSVVARLEQDSGYSQMFGRAFGDEQITGDRMAKALTQFVASLVSNNSRYDKMKKGEVVFNASEQNGYQIFQAKCASCHKEPLFTDFSYRNDGLTLDPVHNDYGRMRVTGRSEDSLKFKVPSLRNVALTAYYGHDGRFEAISEVLDHYSDGIVSSPTLDPLLVNKIPLTDLEKFYLEEFFFTLTDSSVTYGSRYNEP